MGQRRQTMSHGPAAGPGHGFFDCLNPCSPFDELPSIRGRRPLLGANGKTPMMVSTPEAVSNHRGEPDGPLTGEQFGATARRPPR